MKFKPLDRPNKLNSPVKGKTCGEPMRQALTSDHTEIQNSFTPGQPVVGGFTSTWSFGDKASKKSPTKGDGSKVY